MDYRAHFDAAFYKNGTAKLGLAILTAEKTVVCKSSVMTKGINDSMEAEYLALLKLIKLIISLNLNSVRIIGDCKDVIKAVNNEIFVKSKYIKYVKEAKQLIRFIKDYEVKFVNRKKNRVADRLTRIKKGNETQIS